MRNSRIKAYLRPWQLKRNRRGYTLMEAILVLAIGSILVFGMGILTISVRENMWINSQIRNAGEFGKNYCHLWEKVVRNAAGTEIRRNGPPSEFLADYIPPEQPISDEFIERYLFKFNRAQDIPEVRVNGVRKFYDLSEDYAPFPPSTDNRDYFSSYSNGRKGFKIERCTRSNLPASYRDKFLTMSFTIKYRRAPTLRGQRWFEKEIPFTASAYTVNTSWPINYLESSLVP